MKTILLADPVRYPRMTTEELRATFLLEGSYEPGALNLSYVDLDRAVVGMAAPTGKANSLPTFPELRASYFTERREIGILNIGGPGAVCRPRAEATLCATSMSST
jgi:4-deoxy-L-threo-5-hexosulose-uronate ketol-isomerase